MNRMYRKILGMGCFLGLVTCGSSVLQESRLNGYEKKNLRMKYHTKLTAHATDNGKVYLLKEDIRYSKGADRRNTRTSLYMNEDFTLISYESSQTRNQNTNTVRYWVEDGFIHVIIEQNGEQIKDVQVPLTKPVLGELHPLLYSKDLTLKGSRQTYTVFLYSTLEIKEVAVECMGMVSMPTGKAVLRGLHYKVESASQPDYFDHFYLDPDTKTVMEIKTQYLHFKLK